jgi:hypothetical protein
MLLKCLETAHNIMQYLLILKVISLKTKTLQFNINGVFYTRTTNDKGIAMIGINLNPGKYIITAKNLVTGEQSSNIITVKSLIVQKDLTKHYLNASKFQTTIYNKDGSLAVNKEVTFNNKVEYYIPEKLIQKEQLV